MPMAVCGAPHRPSASGAGPPPRECRASQQRLRGSGRVRSPWRGGWALGRGLFLTQLLFLLSPKLYVSCDLGKKWMLLHEQVTKDHVFW